VYHRNTLGLSASLKNPHACIGKEITMNLASLRHQSFGRISTRRRPRARRAMSWRSQLGGIAVAVALMAGCSSTPASNSVHPSSGSPGVSTSTSTSATAAPVAAHGVEAALADVPWARVGPGWTLATWSAVTAHMPGEPPDPNEPTSDTATTTLYLVDPDGVAWQLPSGTFLQSAGVCGSMFLSRLTPDMHTARVSVPGMSDSVVVAGVAVDKLVLLGKVGGGGTTSLVTYDPTANTSTVLLGPPVNGGGVTDALPYQDKT
jgi:hypothetical protein